MFFPRFNTLAITLFCALISFNLFQQTWVIPLVFLHWLTIIAMAIFATGGAVMFIGSFGIHKASTVLEIDRTSYLGRMMRYVVQFRFGDDQDELHCCDIYIASTGATISVLVALAGLFLVLVFAFVTTLLLTENLWNTLIGVGVVTGALVALFGIFRVAGYIFDKLYERNARQAEGWVLQKPAREIPKWLRNVGLWIRYTVLVAFCIGVLGLAVYAFIVLPVSTMMTAGYTLLAAIGIYVLSLSMIGFPLFCIAGKKLVRKTGALGDRLCPTVRQTRF